MTIANTSRIAGPFIGNSVQTGFPFSFKVFSGADLAVVRTDTSTGIATTLTLNSDYTVSLSSDQNANPGGTVVLSSPLATGSTLAITSVLAATQTLDLTNNGGFYPRAISDAFDRVVILIQQLFNNVGRSLKFPLADAANADLPPAAQRANNLLGFDAAGKPVAVAPAAQSASALQALLATSVGATLLGFIQLGTGSVLRTAQDKLREFVSVTDKAVGVVDGVTSNQAGIVAAVADAYARGVPLYWPPGTFVSTANIPNFNDVVHFGPGVLKRGTTVYYITPTRDSHLNTLYVSTTGNDTNDGLDASAPLRTLQRACDIYQNDNVLAKLRQGTWKVYVAAGIYTEGGVWTKAAIAANYVEFYGDVDGSNVPTTIVDGSVSAKTAGLYFDGGASRLKVRNFQFNNFRANSVASGLVFANRGIAIAYTVNVWTKNNLWAGINADSIGQLLIETGTHDGNTNYNLRVRGGVEISIGYNGTAGGNRVTLKNSACASQVRDASTGHFDWFDVINCPTGIWVTNCSRTTTTGATFNTVNLAFRGGLVSVFDYDPTTTFTSVGQRYTLEGNGANDNGDGTGDGLCFDYANNRFTTGFKKWGGTSLYSGAAHAWGTDKTGAAGFSYLVPDGTTAQMIWGTVSSNTLMRLDVVTTTPQWKFVTNGVGSLYFDASSVTSGRDNVSSLGQGGARFSVVYAGTGTINTSDEREKQQIRPIDAAAMRAWSKVDYCQFKFNDAVQAKGDGARWHFGVIAQRVKEAFESEGLDAFEYGVLCFDEWPDHYEPVYAERPAIGSDGLPHVDEDGKPVMEIYDTGEQLLTKMAGNRYGVRYEEALALECAYLRSKLSST